MLLHAKIGGRAFWGVVDSGATLNVVDSESPLASAIQPAVPKENSTPEQRSAMTLGERQFEEKRLRPPTFEFGPMHLTEPLVAINAASSPSDRIAGQIGNGVFSRCTAVVFDMEKRTLWLEPPCNRDVPEDLAGWILEKKASTSYPHNPWVVKFVIPGGSADLAGIQAGDRILQLAGKPAILDISTFESITKQSPGTKVSASIVRGHAKKKVTLHLVRLLAHR